MSLFDHPSVCGIILILKQIIKKKVKMKKQHSYPFVLARLASILDSEKTHISSMLSVLETQDIIDMNCESYVIIINVLEIIIKASNYLNGSTKQAVVYIIDEDYYVITLLKSNE